MNTTPADQTLLFDLFDLYSSLLLYLGYVCKCFLWILWMIFPLTALLLKSMTYIIEYDKLGIIKQSLKLRSHSFTGAWQILLKITKYFGEWKMAEQIYHAQRKQRWLSLHIMSMLPIGQKWLFFISVYMKFVINNQIKFRLI